MKYIIGLTSEQEAKEISRLCYAAHRPPSERANNDPTIYAYGWIKHPDRDEWAIEYENDSWNIPQKVKERIVDGEIDTELATVYPILQERNNATNYLLSHDSFTVEDLLPSALYNNIKTYDDMSADGWFPTVEGDV